MTSTDPSNGDVEVDRDANVTVTFSEPVDAADGAFSLTCGGAAVAIAVSGGPTAFTLDPADQLPRDAACTLTVEADAVTDQDTEDPPDNGRRLHGELPHRLEHRGPAHPRHPGRASTLALHGRSWPACPAW